MHAAGLARVLASHSPSRTRTQQRRFAGRDTDKLQRFDAEVPRGSTGCSIIARPWYSLAELSSANAQQQCHRAMPQQTHPRRATDACIHAASGSCSYQAAPMQGSLLNAQAACTLICCTLPASCHTNTLCDANKRRTMRETPPKQIQSGCKARVLCVYEQHLAAPTTKATQQLSLPRRSTLQMQHNGRCRY